MPDDRQTKTAAPLTEGRVHKGGLNPASRIYERPPGPGAMRALTDGKAQAAEQDDSYQRGYAAGERRVYLNMLSEALKGLGRDSPEWNASRWAKEREEAIAKLRSVCGEFGDNDWQDNLNLSDIIEKHLERYIEEIACG